MDLQDCTTTLVARCVVLVCYHHRRDRGEPGREELREELGWLAGDAMRWGVRPAAVAAGVLADYRRRCVTLGRPVRVALPSGALLEGTAVDVDAGGALVVEHDGRRVAVSAGDVVHVRSGDAPDVP